MRSETYDFDEKVTGFLHKTVSIKALTQKRRRLESAAVQGFGGGSNADMVANPAELVAEGQIYVNKMHYEPSHCRW